MTSMAYAQGSYTTPSQSPPSASVATPSIMSLEPMMAAAGSEVTIVGTNFKDVKKVLFNGKEAKFNVMSDTVIRATVPSGAKTGPIEVITPAGTFRSSDSFKVGNAP
jgi:hypothetical protein